MKIDGINRNQNVSFGIRVSENLLTILKNDAMKRKRKLFTELDKRLSDLAKLGDNSCSIGLSKAENPKDRHFILSKTYSDGMSVSGRIHLNRHPKTVFSSFLAIEPQEIFNTERNIDKQYSAMYQNNKNNFSDSFLKNFKSLDYYS